MKTSKQSAGLKTSKQSAGLLPPQSPHSSPQSSGSAYSRQGSADGKNKSPRNSNNGDSPSASSCNNQGLDCRLCSVLSDSLGLPLLYSLHEKNPATLPEGLKRTERTFTSAQKAGLDGLFKTLLQKWANKTDHKEPQLSKALAKAVEGCSAVTKFHADYEVGVNYKYTFPRRSTMGGAQPRIDILLSPDKRGEQTGTTPYGLIEVGRNNSSWWGKLDQNLKYIDQLGAHQSDARLRLDHPLLCAVLTLEDEDSEKFAMKLGVFLCVPRTNKKCRMTFLWNVLATNFDDASKAFGLLLRVTSHFAEWRSSNAASYTYLSSNCCKVGEKVLRSYDHRFRPTDRKSNVYEDEKCAEIVGGIGNKILEIPEQNEVNDSYDEFFNKSKDRGLLVIEVPYKEGSHVASSPTDFLPVIEQLQRLHEKGYVHGDIRGFNTVFNNGNSTLIDFDFSGKPSTPYPDGYKPVLNDGIRMGVSPAEEGNENANTKLQYWHDWYALNHLIFRVHEYWHEDEETHKKVVTEIAILQIEGNEIDASTSRDTIQEFFEKTKGLLSSLQERGAKVKPSRIYQRALDRFWGENTFHGATGSPPAKKS